MFVPSFTFLHVLIVFFREVIMGISEKFFASEAVHRLHKFESFHGTIRVPWDTLVVQAVKNQPAVREIWAQSLD